MVGGAWHAGFWNGSASSFVDLHQFLPVGFSFSDARGIWESGGVTYVVGYGLNTVTGQTEALMWVTDVVPEPGSRLVLGAGLAALALRRKPAKSR